MFTMFFRFVRVMIEWSIERLAWLKPISMDLFSSIHPQFSQKPASVPKNSSNLFQKNEIKCRSCFKESTRYIFEPRLRWIQRVSSIQITSNYQKSIFYASLWNQRPFYIRNATLFAYIKSAIFSLFTFRNQLLVPRLMPNHIKLRSCAIHPFQLHRDARRTADKVFSNGREAYKCWY